MPASKTPAQLLAIMNDTDQPAFLMGNFQKLLDEILAVNHVLSETTVLLTAAATTALFTVPTGYVCEISDVEIEGVVAMSGGTSSTLKINDGTTNLLNGTTGATFTAVTATTLIAAGVVVHGNSYYKPSTVDLETKKRFAAGAVINAVVSGTVLTAGTIKVRLIGRLHRS